MKCPNCQSEQAREIQTTQTIQNPESSSPIIVENVPLISCKNCGESFFTAQTMERMEEIRENPQQTIEKTAMFAEF